EGSDVVRPDQDLVLRHLGSVVATAPLTEPPPPVPFPLRAPPNPGDSTLNPLCQGSVRNVTRLEKMCKKSVPEVEPRAGGATLRVRAGRRSSRGGGSPARRRRRRGPPRVAARRCRPTTWQACRHLSRGPRADHRAAAPAARRGRSERRPTRSACPRSRIHRPPP